MNHIQGLDQLADNLHRFAEQTAPRIAVAAANAAAARFARGARRRAPRDSGRLAESIIAAAARLRGRRARANVSTDAPGAAAQELGTHKTPAHPYLRPTQLEDAGPILAAAVADAWRIIG